MWSIQPYGELRWLRCHPVTRSGSAPLARKTAKQQTNFKPVWKGGARGQQQSARQSEWLTGTYHFFPPLEVAWHPGWDARCVIIQFKAPDARQGKRVFWSFKRILWSPATMFMTSTVYSKSLFLSIILLFLPIFLTYHVSSSSSSSSFSFLSFFLSFFLLLPPSSLLPPPSSLLLYLYGHHLLLPSQHECVKASSAAVGWPAAAVPHVHAKVTRDILQREHVHLVLGDLVNVSDLFPESFVWAGSHNARLEMKRKRKIISS